MQIEQITQMAKDTILKHGEHMPMVYVEFQDSKNITLLALPDIFSNERGKAERFFSVGRKMGIDNPDKEIAHLAFISEAWMARYDADKPRPDITPSQDPNRMEVLIVNTLDIVPDPDGGGTVEQDMHVIEMLRDGAGNLIDLLHQKRDEQGEIHSRLLTAFLSGFSSTKVSVERMKEVAIKVAMENGFSEEEAKQAASMIIDDIVSKQPHMQQVYPQAKQKTNTRFRGNARKK